MAVGVAVGRRVRVGAGRGVRVGVAGGGSTDVCVAVGVGVAVGLGRSSVDSLSVTWTVIFHDCSFASFTWYPGNSRFISIRIIRPGVRALSSCTTWLMLRVSVLPRKTKAINSSTPVPSCASFHVSNTRIPPSILDPASPTGEMRTVTVIRSPSRTGAGTTLTSRTTGLGVGVAVAVLVDVGVSWLFTR